MQKCISNVAASQKNKSITSEASCLPPQLASQGYAGRSWPPSHPPPSPVLHPTCRMLHALPSPPKLLSQYTRQCRGNAQPGFPPHWLCHHWEHHQLGPALTTAPIWGLGTGTPPDQSHQAIKDGFHPKACPFVPKAPGLMLSNAPAICRAAHQPGHHQLVYQGLTREAIPAAFYHFSLHLPSQSKQGPSGPAVLRADCSKPHGNE